MATTKYELPDLTYDYGDLEPAISGKIVELHHGKHHRAYVTAANETTEKLMECRRNDDFALIDILQRRLAFNVSGHVLHSLYWKNLSPDGGDLPTGDLAAAIDRDFGSFDLFRKQMIAAAMTTMGSGWAALSWNPVSQTLVTIQIHDHQSEGTQACVPLMVIDAWEHAYYLQYHNDKAKHFESLWSRWNWNDIAARHALAQKLDLGLANATEGLTQPPGTFSRSNQKGTANMKNPTLTRLGIGLVASCGLLSSNAFADHASADTEMKMMDTNGDGKLSAEEHAVGAAKMFEKMDANADGKVNAAEMTAAHEKMMAKKGEKPRMSAADKIKMIDTDGDGVISAEEHAAGSKKMFDKMDTNKDGSLSKAELEAGHAKMMHKE